MSPVEPGGAGQGDTRAWRTPQAPPTTTHRQKMVAVVVSGVGILVLCCTVQLGDQGGHDPAMAKPPWENSIPCARFRHEGCFMDVPDGHEQDSIIIAGHTNTCRDHVCCDL